MTDHNVTTYPVVLHTDTMKAATGHRFCVLRWKAMTGKDGKTKPKLSPDRAVLLPVLPLTVQPIALQKALLECFQSMQDARIRELVEADLTVGRAPAAIPFASMEASSIAEWNDERATGSKLSGDLIKDWFDLSLKDQLFIAICIKKGIDEHNATDAQMTVVEQVVDQHKQLFTKLASPTFTISDEATSRQLLKAANLADENDETTKRVINRIVAMQSKVEVQLENLL